MGERGHLPLVSICALVYIYSYKLTVSNGRLVICLIRYLYVCLYIYGVIALVFSYKLTILNGVSLTKISKEFTPFTGSFKWGVHLPLVSICALVSIYSYKLTVSNGESRSFAFGIYMYIGLYIYRSIIALVFSYKLTILNGVSLIDIDQQRVHSFHWQF